MFVPDLFLVGSRAVLDRTSAAECLEAVDTGSIVQVGADFHPIQLYLDCKYRHIESYLLNTNVCIT